ncbi:hypothetical protein [Vulgatibacter sp.]|uniref:hypothetical protein n=1 Tax=Vulgatibacter sp. TaxID=1971226 RepID=UPI003569293D
MKRTILVVLAALSATACATRYIGNTRIEDTEQNREILRAVEQYRRAVEDRDVERILAMTSDRYFEDPGTPHVAADDYDKVGLRDRLVEAFAKVAEQRLVVDVRKVNVEGDDEEQAQVDYRFDYRYRLDLPRADEWRQQMDLNRLEFRREGEDWKIVSGL